MARALQALRLLPAAVVALALLAPGAQAAGTGGLQYGQASQVVALPGGIDPDAPAPDPLSPTDPGAPIAPPQPGQVAKVLSTGVALAPAGAPAPVVQIIEAANRIARKRYVWGGGHGRWEDRGYDCSGSVSYALHGAALLDEPLVSGDLASWGYSGAGSWVTIYANRDHVYMTVAGLRFDTSGQKQAGTRWQAVKRSNKGYRVRHPAGL